MNSHNINKLVHRNAKEIIHLLFLINGRCIVFLLFYFIIILFATYPSEDEDIAEATSLFTSLFEPLKKKKVLDMVFSPIIFMQLHV